MTLSDAISENVGLTICLISLAVTILGFGSDGIRAWVFGVPTYSEMIWNGLATRGQPGHTWAVIWTCIIIGWLELMPSGIAIHFLT